MEARKNIYLVIRLLILLSACLVFSKSIFAQSVCDEVQCDCAALGIDDWKEVCKTRENFLIRQCKAGVKQETLFCSVHGPAANQLPLALKLSDVEVLATEKLPALYKQVAALYWSVRMDLQALEKDIVNFKPESAQNKLDVLVRNTDTLFELQQKITVSWVAYEKENEAAKSWNDFASDTLDMAGDMEAYGRRIWNQSGDAADKYREQQKTIALALIENSGKVYEQAAYAFGRAGQHDNAARNWRKAADSTGYLIEISSVEDPHSQKIQFLNYQRAARIYRASFHWVKDERESEAKDSLKKAQEVFNGKPDAMPG